ncbi:hypothetical protein E2C01_002180 [Portunus trituberculatus]|uniref:Uncharacterized protein n=1 Tax=Portunus trituberculatus TaxID=210409 RepID=A0A5B7CJW3_PORTR|nr:hypothetical protein [Portunus trituberculatus]
MNHHKEEIEGEEHVKKKKQEEVEEHFSASPLFLPSFSLSLPQSPSLSNSQHQEPTRVGSHVSPITLLRFQRWLVLCGASCSSGAGVSRLSLGVRGREDSEVWRQERRSG